MTTYQENKAVAASTQEDMKVRYTAKTHTSRGRRGGVSRSDDGRLDGALERYWKPICQEREGAGPKSGTLHLAQAQSNRGRRGRILGSVSCQQQLSSKP